MLPRRSHRLSNRESAGKKILVPQIDEVTPGGNVSRFWRADLQETRQLRSKTDVHRPVISINGQQSRGEVAMHPTHAGKRSSGSLGAAAGIDRSTCSTI